jgi:hypothetical protein
VRKDDFGVWKYWAELNAQSADGIEFLHSHGLGVLQIPREPEQNTPNISLKNLPIRVLDFLNSLGSKWELIEANSVLDQANQKHLSQVRKLWSERDQLAIKVDRIDSNPIFSFLKSMGLLKI